MRHATCVFLVLLGGGTSPAFAQQSQQPTIVLTIGGGVVTGHGLWAINRQPICLLNGGGTCSGLYDTMRIARTISPSLVLGASGTYFPWPQVGFHAEISYVGFPNDDACTAIFLHPDPPDERGQQMCDNLSSSNTSSSAISAFVGATLRAASRRAVSPYLRANLGVISFSGSTTEVIGPYVDGSGAHERSIIRDDSPGGMKPMVGLAGGFTSAIGSGYQFRLELRDIIASMDRVTGPASDLAIAPIESHYFHHIALVLGLDVVLEKRRGRRY